MSQLDVSASASVGLSIRELHLTFGSGGISTTLQAVKKIQFKWGQKVLAKAFSNGSPLKRTSLVWSDLGYFFSGGISLLTQQLH